MTIREAELTEDVLQTLIALSEDWAAEQSSHGYRKNERAPFQKTVMSAIFFH